MSDTRFPNDARNQRTDDVVVRADAYRGTAAMDSGAASVLRNTYLLLAMTIGFSGVVAYLSMSAARPHFLIVLVGFYGLLFAINKFQNSALAIPLTFGLTGFMGYTLGPIIGMFAGAGAMPIVANALMMTAVAFVGLSAIVLVTRKDFSFLSSFLAVGFFILLAAMIASIFLQIPALSLAISAGFTLFSAAAILYETSAIIQGGQRNYVLATVGLYVSIYNMFLSLLNILTALSGGDD